MIFTKDLSFHYNDKKVFNFPDFSCNANESLLITGNSGVGKTTLLHLLGGLLTPNSGKINIDGTNIATLKGKSLDNFRGNHISIILQKSYFVDSLNVLENLELISWIAQSKKQTSLAKNILNELGLGEYLHKKTYELSIGQQQRLSIARALINEPKVILADEPTASLDDENATIVIDLLEKISKNQKAALIIVTHDNRLKEKITKNLVL